MSVPLDAIVVVDDRLDDGHGGSRPDIVTALIYAAPDDPETFHDFIRLGRLRRLCALGESFSAETLADLEERFS